MSVMLAYLHPNTVCHNFMHSILSTIIYESERDRMQELDIVPVYSGPYLHKTRNTVVEGFLGTKHDWLWFVDNDLGFYGNTLENLLGISDIDARPVVCAPYLMPFVESPNGLGGWNIEMSSGLYMFNQDESEIHSIVNPPENTLLQVDVAGSGCMMIHKTVLSALGADWFSELDGLGEDVSFCKRLKSAGIPLYAHTGIPTSHQKLSWLTTG